MGWLSFSYQRAVLKEYGPMVFRWSGFGYIPFASSKRQFTHPINVFCGTKTRRDGTSNI